MADPYTPAGAVDTGAVGTGAGHPGTVRAAAVGAGAVPETTVDADAVRVGALRPGALRAAAVVLAGGSGTRVGARRDDVPINKVHLPFAGRSVLAWSFHRARQAPAYGTFVLVARAEDLESSRELLAREVPDLDVEVVAGGACRHDSEMAGLRLLAERIQDGALDVVAIHDGARPLAETALWQQVAEQAAARGSAIPVVEVPRVLPAALLELPSAVPLGRPSATMSARSEACDRAEEGSDPTTAHLLGPRLAGAQTPQAFRAMPLLTAFEAAAAAGFEGTDTASTVAWAGTTSIHAVQGSRRNIKITWPEDVPVAARLLDRD